MPPNAHGRLRRGPPSARGVDELLAEPKAWPVCALRMNFCRLDPSTNGVRRWIDGCEFEQADQCKRIFAKGLGESRAVSSANTTVRGASRGFSRLLSSSRERLARKNWPRRVERPESTLSAHWLVRAFRPGARLLDVGRWLPDLRREMALHHVDYLLPQHHAQQADQCDQRRGRMANLDERISHADNQAHEEGDKITGHDRLPISCGRSTMRPACRRREW